MEALEIKVKSKNTFISSREKKHLSFKWICYFTSAFGKCNNKVHLTFRTWTYILGHSELALSKAEVTSVLRGMKTERRNFKNASYKKSRTLGSMGNLEKNNGIILLLLRKQERMKLTGKLIRLESGEKPLKGTFLFFQVRQVLEYRLHKLITRFAAKLLTPIWSLRYTDKAIQIISAFTQTHLLRINTTWDTVLSIDPTLHRSEFSEGKRNSLN